MFTCEGLVMRAHLLKGLLAVLLSGVTCGLYWGLNRNASLGGLLLMLLVMIVIWLFILIKFFLFGANRRIGNSR